MENRKKEAWKQLGVGTFRLLSIIAIFMFTIACVGTMATGSDLLSPTELPQWIKICLISSLAWFGVLFIWAIGLAVVVTVLTVTEDIIGAIKKLKE